MDSLFGTGVDLKNIGLSKLLFDVRQDLDVHCVLEGNWTEISGLSNGGMFLSQVRRRALEAVILGICKIYEKEKHVYPLNSIDRIVSLLRKENSKRLDEAIIREFVQRHNGTITKDSVASLQSAIDNFKQKYSIELEQFKDARDKVIAHSEFAVLIETVPSYDVMERLFTFGVEFYEIVNRAFVGCNPDNLHTNRPVKVDLVRLLETMGITAVKEDLV